MTPVLDEWTILALAQGSVKRSRNWCIHEQRADPLHQTVHIAAKNVPKNTLFRWPGLTVSPVQEHREEPGRTHVSAVRTYM
jgi:hypothetical protein